MRAEPTLTHAPYSPPTRPQLEEVISDTDATTADFTQLQKAVRQVRRLLVCACLSVPLRKAGQQPLHVQHVPAMPMPLLRLPLTLGCLTLPQMATKAGNEALTHNITNPELRQASWLAGCDNWRTAGDLYSSGCRC